MTSPDPVYDEGRLEEIAELGLLNDDVDPILDEIAGRAASSLGMPVSLVSVVLDVALHVAAAHGITGLWLDDTRGHPLEWSFCATSVRSREAFVVPNAEQHPQHATNPLVTQDGVRCYAGVPLVSSRGHVLGNLCVVGMEERTFTEAELALLRGLAVEAVQHLEARARG
jgi:GAF domain-containing protein